MLRALLSDDLPRSRWLAVAAAWRSLVGLAVAPFLFPGAKSLNVAAKICVFIVLAASFDLLLGYTGIVSFAHTMFFGIGAYGVAIALTRMGPAGTPSRSASRPALRSPSRWRRPDRPVQPARAHDLLRHDHAGRGQRLPDPGVAALRPHRRRGRAELPPAVGAARRSFRPFEGVTGRVLDYYLVYFVSLALVLILLRIVNSPFGSVLMAIRENPFRAEAIGYRTVVYRTLASCIAAATAALAGALLALWSSQTNPDTTLTFDIMVDILLMVVIGGMGTIYGAAIGAVLLVFAQNYLQDLLAVANKALAGVPLLGNLFHPDRWLLWLGVPFILCVYFFPTGIVGRLRRDAEFCLERR